ncbi:adenine phosphoribosyltransferase-like protein [Euroglyphus maynei]|uniref:Adenine phosphoribosyltransferase n=1 Tax=Euroglyphus maynei TaxID=6958 RepID=A0A1Y3BFQ7_EURMA|nr:adenine phosphoribosyltransferase-like protein [Euroglyphus maynei]
MTDDGENVQKRLDRIKMNVKSFPDFPKPGIIFRDMFPLFQDPGLLDDVLYILKDHIGKNVKNYDTIIGLESRGFLFGPLLAYELRVPFVPIRKAGKLPGKVESIAYDLEYGSDKFEIQIDSVKPNSNCIIVDDLLATGGSARSAVELIRKCGANVVNVIVLIELIDLKGRLQYPEPTFSLVTF